MTKFYLRMVVDMFYRFTSELTIDKIEDSMILKKATDNKIVCFDKHASMIIQRLIEDGLENTMKYCIERYEGVDIENDIICFVAELVSKNYLVEYE